MTDSPVERLIGASSLGTPDAVELRQATSDETAAQIVARAEQFAAEEPHRPYYCPTSDSVECCPEHSGWQVCCDRPDLHQPDVGQATWPTLAEWAPHLIEQARQPERTPPKPDDIEQLRARIVDRTEHETEVRAALDRLDGTTASAVALLSGIPVDQLDQYGGITSDRPASNSPPAALARLVDTLSATLSDETPPADGMCQAVWRDPADGALVACALDAEPGHDWCTTHLHRDRAHRIRVFHDRADAVRVQAPPGFTASA